MKKPYRINVLLSNVSKCIFSTYNVYVFYSECIRNSENMWWMLKQQMFTTVYGTMSLALN